MDFEQFMETNGQVIPYVIGLFVVCLGVTIVMLVMHRKRSSAFLAEHPDAVKVLLAVNTMAGQSIQVHTVGGEKPVLLTEKTKSGFYALPGKNELSLSYTSMRPGVVYRTVAKTYGPITKEITVKAGKKYALSFDKKTEDFELSEV